MWRFALHHQFPLSCSLWASTAQKEDLKIDMTKTWYLNTFLSFPRFHPSLLFWAPLLRPLNQNELHSCSFPAQKLLIDLHPFVTLKYLFTSQHADLTACTIIIHSFVYIVVFTCWLDHSVDDVFYVLSFLVALRSQSGSWVHTSVSILLLSDRSIVCDYLE